MKLAHPSGQLCAIAVLFASPCQLRAASAQNPLASEPLDNSSIIDRIRDEGLNHSQAMQTLSYLTDVIGPRLTGSPNLKRANEWTRDTLTKWGLHNAHLEEWGPFGRGWSLVRFSIQIVEPQTIILIAYPKAWTPGFDKPFTAPVVWIDATTDSDLDKYAGKLKGAVVLAGAMRPVEPRFDPPASRLNDSELLALADSTPGANMFAGIPRAGSAADAPGGQRRARAGAASRPSSAPFGRRRGEGRFAGRILAFAAKQGAALVIDPSSRGDGGIVFVAGASVPSAPGESPFDPNRPRVWSADCPPIPAQACMASEDYNRLARMIKQGQKLKMSVDLQVRYNSDDPMAYNTIAEIPGTDPALKDQIVMAGGHMDSWQAGTGATDNGVGVAVAMEALRILSALDLKPRRTIRIGLWSGEEEGLLGSRAYVTKHFGSYPGGRGMGGGFGPPRRDDGGDEPPTRPLARAGRDPGEEPAAESGGGRVRVSRDESRDEPTSRPVARGRRGRDRDAPSGRIRNAGRARPDETVAEPSSQAASRPARKLTKGPDYEKLSIYFNLDNGAGKIRGVFMQGNEAARPYFRSWLEPFADLGATTLTPSNTGSTDHVSFDAVGLPGFQFIQDPIDYFNRTHHSSADVYDRIPADDVKQAATILAAFLYDAAQMDERFPRKPLR